MRMKLLFLMFPKSEAALENSFVSNSFIITNCCITKKKKLHEFPVGNK